MRVRACGLVEWALEAPLLRARRSRLRRKESAGYASEDRRSERAERDRKAASRTGGSALRRRRRNAGSMAIMTARYR